MSTPAASTASSRVTQAELARELMVSRQAIGDLIKRGVLKLGDDGRLDSASAKTLILDRIRPGARTASTAAGAAPEAAPPAAPAAPKAEQPTATDTVTNYHIARTLREATEASIAQLKLRQMQGNLIDRETAVNAAFTAFRTLRDSIGYLPHQLAEKLAPMTSPREIELVLQQALRETLDSYATKVLPKLTAHMGASAVPGEAAK